MKLVFKMVCLVLLAMFTHGLEASVAPAIIDMGMPTAVSEGHGILGTTDVHETTDSGHNVQVWRVQSQFYHPGKFRLSMQHAVAGAQGSFYLIAWTDIDGNGIPDKEIGRSELKTGNSAGAWSSWDFTSTAENIFVGNTWSQNNEKIYYSQGSNNSYHGIENKLFFSRTFDAVPNQFVSPRYTNIKFSALFPEQKVLGVTTHEIQKIDDTGHNVQVWAVKPEFSRPGKYTISIKHAVAGSHGGFYIIAWADTTGNGIPDREIGRSELKIADMAGEWSSWSFNADASCRKIFVGNTWSQSDEKIFYLMENKLVRYEGLEDKLFFARKFNAVPNKSTQPRYTNIKVTVH
ncbi:MAG: hypothetical protein CVV42_07805 [Candidatus Riflebacteria bacterium HGW-Riflebacteria-2]|jgi:hypothetical protein|nr:MAG: hypothetical protein CVV42_07805 [Candidatus Riflebacteria bacterium HGW-Riflebacteria-2]